MIVRQYVDKASCCRRPQKAGKEFWMEQQSRGFAPNRELLDLCLVASAARAWSPNTIRAILSDLRRWDRWCRGRGAAMTRAAPINVVASIHGHRARSADGAVQRSAATIARYLIHIGWAYRMAGVDDRVATTLEVLEHKAALRVLGARQGGYNGDVADLHAPLAGVSLIALLKARRRDMLRDRDRALLIVYDTGCRRSELIGSTIDDIRGRPPGR